MASSPEVYYGKDDEIKKASLCRPIPPFSVKYKDVFNLKNLYVMMHELLLEEGWLGWENNEEGMQSHSDLEILYSENVYQKGIHHGGKEYWVWWRANKQWERSNNYFRFALDIDWHLVGMSDVEIVHQGKKMKSQKGELEIFFNAKLLSDIGLTWEKHPFLKHWKKIYEKRIIYADIEKREKELWREVYRIQSKLKAYLKLRTWMPEAPSFHSPMTGFEGTF